MSTELNVCKETVCSLFSGNKRYEIPVFQRPYNWTEEECSQLWEDLLDFLNYEIGSSRSYSGKMYYLGAVVTIEGARGKRSEVIDGQQRMTSLLLLLRAFYNRFEQFEKDGDSSFSTQRLDIQKCLWAINPETGKYDPVKDLRLMSLVEINDKAKTLQKILSEGRARPGDKSNYAQNFRLFGDLIDGFISYAPGKVRRLCTVILNNCVVFPIQCRVQDEALRIFKTLNDRGLELSDSDIFKSHLYQYARTSKDKKDFIANWERLNEIVSSTDLTIDNIFKYYSYYVIACEVKDSKSKQLKKAGSVSMERETDLRKFFIDNKKRLASPKLIDDLIDLASFWGKVANLHDEKARRKDNLFNAKAARYFHCLENYPNVNWRRVVSVFYLVNRKRGMLDKREFEKFLARLLAYLCVKYIAKPTVDSIRTGIAQGCAELVASKRPEKVYNVKSSALKCEDLKEQLSPDHFNAKNKKLVKTLILLHAYLVDAKGESLIVKRFQVEHILPQHWNISNYGGWTEETAAKYLEQISNKMPLEAIPNVTAGAKFFEQKKKSYAKSDIVEAQLMAKIRRQDWRVDDVIERGAKMTERLFTFFSRSLAR